MNLSEYFEIVCSWKETLEEKERTIQKLAAECIRLKKEKGDWISVKERLPEADQIVLSTDGKKVAATIFVSFQKIEEYFWEYLSSGCGCCDEDMKDEDMKGVTYWMPLPNPPGEK
jgi:hypothetical protein